MITRIFRVQIHKEYVADFEKAYEEVSIPLVKSQKGFVSLSTGSPMTKENLEYVMISHWESLEALKKFVGEDWQEALIPKGMEKYVDQCWLHHYESDEKP